MHFLVYGAGADPMAGRAQADRVKVAGPVLAEPPADDVMHLGRARATAGHAGQLRNAGHVPLALGCPANGLADLRPERPTSCQITDARVHSTPPI